MTRRIILSLIVLLALALIIPHLSLAGGWAIVELDALPAPIAGEALQIGFTTRQHGDKPFKGEPYLTAKNTATGETIRAEGEPEGTAGHHVVEVTFPSAGLWEWSITPAPFPNTNEFYPLRVLPPALDVSEGQALFVAKGCVGCHYHPDIPAGQFEQAIPADTGTPWTGVNFATYEGTPEFLRVWLKDPKAVKPKTAMPNLNLKETEIEALIPFINRTKSAEARQAVEGETPQQVANITMPKPTPTDLFLVRPEGPRGSLVVYDMAERQPQFSLPPGMLSPDGQRYYTAEPRGDRTIWQVFEPQTGSVKKRLSLPGHWTVSAVSQTGRWLTLTRPADEKAGSRETGIQIIDTETGTVVHRLELEGDFEAEAVSPSGDGLFLIEYLTDKQPPEYVVRLYDLSANRLDPNPLRSKSATDEVMAGYAWGGLASPDGRWLLTLYLNTDRQVAFIHALNLIDKFPICLFLPSGDGNFDQLKDYTLTLSPGGRTVYAANTSLGVVAEVSLESFEVTRQVEFAATQPVAGGKTEAAERPANHSLLTKDGSRLYFTGGDRIWVYDPRARKVHGPVVTGAPIDGLGLNRDETQLFVAGADGQVSVFNVGAETLTSVQP